MAGRDPSGLDATELCRAASASVAENTADAIVGSLVWGAAGGPAAAPPTARLAALVTAGPAPLDREREAQRPPRRRPLRFDQMAPVPPLPDGRGQANG